MSVGFFIGIGVLLLIVVIALKQRADKSARPDQNADGGSAAYLDSGSNSADCSSDGGSGGCD